MILIVVNVHCNSVVTPVATDSLLIISEAHHFVFTVFSQQLGRSGKCYLSSNSLELKGES